MAQLFFRLQVTACVPTENGNVQWAAFNEESDKTCLGWAHSHHQQSLIPQGRVPSGYDVNTQFTLQQNFPVAKMMLILNENGYSMWTLPHEAMEVLRQLNGDCAGPTATMRPEEFAQPATFVELLRNVDFKPVVRRLGASLAPGVKPVVCTSCGKAGGLMWPTTLIVVTHVLMADGFSKAVKDGRLLFLESSSCKTPGKMWEFLRPMWCRLDANRSYHSTDAGLPKLWQGGASIVG